MVWSKNEPHLTRPQRRPRRRRWRPQLQRAAALQLHSELVGRHLARTREHAAQVLRAGQALVFIDDHGLFKEARDSDGQADKDIYAWVERVHRLKRDQANKYLTIGRALTTALVADLAASVEALYLLAQADPRVRGALRAVLQDQIGGARFELASASATVWLEQGVAPEAVQERVPRVARGQLSPPSAATRKVLRRGRRRRPPPRGGFSQALRVLTPLKGALLAALEADTPPQKSDEKNLLLLESDLRLAVRLLKRIRERRDLGPGPRPADLTKSDDVKRRHTATGETFFKGRARAADRQDDEDEEPSDLEGHAQHAPYRTAPRR